MKNSIGGLLEGAKVMCVEGEGSLKKDQVYTLGMRCLSTDKFACLEEEEVAGIAWRVDRFLPAKLHKGTI